MPNSTHPPFDQLPDDPRSDANTLRVENEALRRGFTLIPNYILRARGISRDAKLLYGILLSYAWQTDSCFPGYDTLMEDMQCAREALAKYIKELKSIGLIAVQRRGQGMTSIYTLKDIQGADVQKFENRTSRSSDLKLQEVRKSNANKYSVEKDSDEENSKSRKAPPQTQAGSNDAAHHHGTASSRIRQVTPSDVEEDEDDISLGTTPRKQQQGQMRGKGDMSLAGPGRRGGVEAIGATLLQRRPGRPTATEAEARRAIRQYIEDYARELGDQAPKSSVTRAINLMREANVSVGTFIAAMQAAKKRTQQRSASIVKMAEGGKSPYPQKIKMPYFFSLLEEELGLKEPGSMSAATRS